MRTAHKLLLCACAVVGLSAGIGTGVAVYLQPEPVLLACPDVNPIPETRWAQVTEAQLNTWPVPPEATPIPAPRRSVQRKRNPLTAAPLPVEQCAFPPSAGLVPDLEPNLVPEPSSASIAVLGLLALAVVRRKKKAKP